MTDAKQVAREIVLKVGRTDDRTLVDEVTAILRPHLEPAAQSSGFICGKWKRLDDGCVARCDQPDKHEGKHIDSVIAISWDSPSTSSSGGQVAP